MAKPTGNTKRGAREKKAATISTKPLHFWKTIEEIKEPLLVCRSDDFKFDDVVEVVHRGEKRLGKVISIDGEVCTVELLEGTYGLGEDSAVRTFAKPFTFPMSNLLLGRVLSGLGKPLDKKPSIVLGKEMNVNGAPLNPTKRTVPNNIVKTGFASIDLLNPLAMGQKLAMFSSPGLPVVDFSLDLVRQSLENMKKDFVVVFVGIGLIKDEEAFIMNEIEKFKLKSRSVFFINTTEDPLTEAVVTPRIALTAAEYFAYERGKDVLVIMGDMLNYGNALREMASLRGDLLTRHGYPSYLFSDFASLYERCGMLSKRKGSITLLPYLTMPNDDITHPVPDTTGYISEGQLVMTREVLNKGVNPPLDILLSLSRMAQHALDKEALQLSHKIYNLYAQGKKYEEIASLMGADVLSQEEQKFVDAKVEIEKELLSQEKEENRRLSEIVKIATSIVKKYS
ncbi:MAG: V-type ATP synthase subunit B [Methanobacteriota archaeon]|nr:MAG: V-type ATP synthase subunit B [Euryarchaeota archaeon]